MKSKSTESQTISVVCRTGDSGVTDYSICLILELQRQFKVNFISAESALKHPLSSSVKIVPVFRRFRNLFVDYFSFLKIVYKNRPRILLLQSWIGFPLIDAVLVRLIRVIGVQTAVTAHDIAPHHPTLFSKLTVGFFFKSFDRVIAHSDEAHSKLRDMGVQVPILVVPHGEYGIFNIDQLQQSDARKMLGGDLPVGAFVALFFGHLDERKGLEEFLQAASDIHSPLIRFIVAGRNDLSLGHQYLLGKEWPSNIRLDVGHVPFERVQQYFSASDVVVTPYREGSTSGVLKIAMAFGKPVIASDVGDMTETMKDWPGILISSKNIKSELVLALNKMLTDRNMFSLSASTSREKYSWKTIGVIYADFLTDGDSSLNNEKS